MRWHTWLALTVLLSLGSLAWQLHAAPATPTAPSAAPTTGATSAAPTGAAQTPSAPTTNPAPPAAKTTGGAAGTPAPAAQAQAPKKRPIRPDVLLAYWIGVALLAVVLIVLARTTALLRDRGNGTPWSLGRTQMAWWFFFVVASFVFIWLATTNYASLSNSVLALIGISSGTALAGAVIDDGKQSQMQQRPQLQTEQNQLQQANQQLAPAPAPGAAAPAVNPAAIPILQANLSRLGAIATQLAQIPSPQQPRQSFWRDILSDENGISFHRFQIVTWTLVLTVIFVWKVKTASQMPDFDPKLLGLMGISSGTYIGFKFPEKQA
jgi:hypothetical protein